MIRRTTFRQLQVFCAVAQASSIVRASEALHLTQPAVSMQLKQLEQALGIDLFDRHGRALSLTEAGTLFHEHALRVLAELHDAEETLNQLKGLRGGSVTVGMVSTAKYFVPRLLARFAAQHPALDLRILTGNRDDLIGYLRRNAIDLAIMGRPPRGLELETAAFATHPYVFVAPPTHRFANARGIDLFDLRDETMLLRESGSGTRVLNDEYFRKCLFAPKRSIEMGSNETIKQAIMAGMGIALISRHTLGLELQHGLVSVLDVVGLPIVRNWHVAHNVNRRLGPAAKAMREFVFQNGAEFLVEMFGRDVPRPGRRVDIATPPAAPAIARVAEKTPEASAGKVPEARRRGTASIPAATPTKRKAASRATRR
ncbi:LysR substrate-binding domain-containing protein [Dokdonella sp. MW10]|uniref:LysR family transcriptional regulator n=1 Tax=Dokdonella sp. MW10 TaxID=2992926 RepID=UPI003F7DFDDB